MGYNNEAPFQIRKHIQLLGGVNIETITGPKTLTVADSTFQMLDGGASDRDVTLPAEEDGIYFWIVNSGSSNNLVVKDVGASTVATVANGQGGLFVSDGATFNLVIKA
tara:strand:- start:470 stop:793 length:324 start_codon:yes stop_codon:yes gene_type:complete